MNPEEYLDHLIERHEQGELYVPTINDEVAASMAAMEQLSQLNEIHIPHRFANHLELSIRARVRDLNMQNTGNIPYLNSHNLNEQNRWNISPIQSHNTVKQQAIVKRRVWVALLRIAAVFVIVGVGVLTASARSLPGDALYSLNQAEKEFSLTFAGAPQNRATLQINQLQSALVDLNTVVKEGRDDDSIRLALNTVAAETSDSQEAVAALPADSTRGKAQQALTSALAEEEQILQQLLNRVDWPMQLDLTQQLGSLGEPVPTVSNAVVHLQSNGMLLITVTGSGFAPQAQLLIDGQQIGIVKQITPTQLIDYSNNIAWFKGGSYAIGVRNADGTAAQLIINSVNEDNSDKQDDNHSRHGTPIPYPTGGTEN